MSSSVDGGACGVRDSGSGGKQFWASTNSRPNELLTVLLIACRRFKQYSREKKLDRMIMGLRRYGRSWGCLSRPRKRPPPWAKFRSIYVGLRIKLPPLSSHSCIFVREVLIDCSRLDRDASIGLATRMSLSVPCALQENQDSETGSSYAVSRCRLRCCEVVHGVCEMKVNLRWKEKALH